MSLSSNPSSSLFPLLQSSQHLDIGLSKFIIIIIIIILLLLLFSQTSSHHIPCVTLCDSMIDRTVIEGQGRRLNVLDEGTKFDRETKCIRGKLQNSC